MSQVHLSRDEARFGHLPPVCMRCGALATTTRERVFSNSSETLWVVLFLFAAAFCLPLLILLLLSDAKRMRARLPFCEAHKNDWRRLAWLSYGGLAALYALVVFAFYVGLGLSAQWPPAKMLGGYLCAAIPIAAVVWLIVVAISHSRSVRVTHLTTNRITLAGVAPQFVQALETERETHPDSPYPDSPGQPSRAAGDTARPQQHLTDIQLEPTTPRPWPGHPVPDPTPGVPGQSGDTEHGYGRATPPLQKQGGSCSKLAIVVGFLLLVLCGVPAIVWRLTTRFDSTDELFAPVRRGAQGDFRRGVEAYNRDDFDAAIAAFDKSIQADPNNAPAYHNRGLAHARKRNFDLALADLDRAIRLNPKDVGACLLRIGVLEEQGHLDRAVTDYLEMTQREPDNALAHGLLATAYNARGKHERSIPTATEAIRLDPNLYLGYSARGYGYFNRAIETGEEADYRRAISDFSEAVRLNPKAVDAVRTRARCFRALGDDDNAERDERRARALER